VAFVDDNAVERLPAYKLLYVRKKPLGAGRLGRNNNKPGRGSSAGTWRP
jgi:hypothetical protein